MENSFINSVHRFIQSLNLEYELKDGIFYFHKNKIIIIPLVLNDYKREAKSITTYDILYLYEDRWRTGGDDIKMRIKSRLGIFKSIFARKCEIVKGGGAQDFINSNHPYGAIKSKYTYALLYNGDIVAAASFSASRPLPRRVDSPYENVPKEYHSLYELVTVNSYEWLRFAILPGVRVVGGMSKILASFINDIKSNAPFEIMSYSDNEWSNGSGYEKLGFKYVNEKIPVLYYIDKNSFNRYSQYQLKKLPFAKEEDYYRIENKGSKKYILKKW